MTFPPILTTLFVLLSSAVPAHADLCAKAVRKADADVVLEAVKDAKGNGGVRACIYMDSTTDEVYATLTDYPSFTKWMDKVDKIKAEWSDDKTALVDYTVGTMFGDWKYQLRRTHDPVLKKIWWERTTGDFKTVKGEYHFYAVPGDAKGSLFLIETYVDPGKSVPSFVQNYFQEKGTRRLLKDIREETRKRRK